jgi:exocyst complex component 1
MNSNGSFSVGKTWKLHELRAVEVVNVSYISIISPRCVLMQEKPLAFHITLARTYKWKTERPNEQLSFLHALVGLFRTVSNGSLQVIGLPEVDTLSGAMHVRPV